MLKQAKQFIALWLSILFVGTSVFIHPWEAAADMNTAADQASSADQQAVTFSWDNANVYFVLTDRFKDGDPSNNNSYGRPQRDAAGKNIGTFHGGDLKGLTQKLQEGYFTDLGTNVIWISAPYEQMHGWVGGGDGGDFAHYGYHGYYALDYTMMDRNMGTVNDMREFVDLAHSQGIRVVLDVILNHPGYSTLKDMEEYGFGARNGIGASWTPGSGQNWHSYHDMIDYNNSSAWSSWWGNWVRAGIAGYENCGGNDLTQCVGNLPDFRTNVTSNIGLAPILRTKWAKETTGHDAWIVPAASNLRKDLGVAPADYVVKWLAAWVEEFGIDGFRADTAKHVELSRWKQLKDESSAALQKWRQNNPGKPGADWNDDFWMTGEVWGHGVGKSEYFNYGFDSIINFSFQDSNMNALEGTYADYASRINSDPNFNVLSYISSHDTRLYDRSRLIQAGSALLLLPGGVQTFYGDEAARAFGETGSDPHQGTRSSMNWNSLNQDVLSHWQKVGQFRNRHLSVGAGSHAKIGDAPYTFKRIYSKHGIDDKVVVVMGASGSTQVNVSSVFADGSTLRDAYTGEEAMVTGGFATFTAHANGLILIEQTAESNLPAVSASPAGGNFKTDTLTIKLHVKKAESGKYTLDGSDPSEGIPYTDGSEITIGDEMEFDDSATLRLYAVNEEGSSMQQYEYTKKDPDAGLTIYFKKPADWGTPQLYYYDTLPKVTEPTWTTSPTMTKAAGEWYSYKIEGTDGATVIFKDGSGKQNPGQNQPGFVRTSDGWYDGRQWHESNPDGPEDTEAPTAPEQLRSTAVTDTTVTLAWEAAVDNVGVASYDVYRGTEKVGSSAATTYTDKGLAPQTSYTYTVKARDAAGNVSPASDPLEVTTEAPGTGGNRVTVYYKHGFSDPYLHYRPEGGTWTAVPGIVMEESEVPGYSKYTVDIGTASRLEACFTDGKGNWDSNNGKNYFFHTGIWTYLGNGKIQEGAPDPDAANKVTIYYKHGFSVPYLHYRPEGGTWTAVPGAVMEASEVPGYSKYTVDIGTASRLEACFTDGKGNWDSNNMKNYFFGIGTWSYNGSGQIVSGPPVSPGSVLDIDIQAAPEPNVLPLLPGVENPEAVDEELPLEDAMDAGAEAA
ncbi:carbohydrate binding domain-containing protein [Paenibacillus lentus]|uniref:carbohydrate binding domain-containing protein n=1 Tax=Paenibacillus lentus TaxID=1338368 RepID=UPI00364CAC27